MAAGTSLFDRLMNLDTTYQQLFVKNIIPHIAEVVDSIYECIVLWFEFSQSVLARADQLSAEGESLEGDIEFRKRVRQANSILTPDDEFFDSELLVEKRDAAIDELEANQTIPWPEKG